MLCLILSVLRISAQATYYVSSTGSGDTCLEDNPCYSINQVFSNYAGTDFTLFIDTGIYMQSSIIALQQSAQVVFIGAGAQNTVLRISSRSIAMVTVTETSGFEFRDVALDLSGQANAFTVLNAAGNNVGFYNVLITFTGFVADFVDLSGGVLTLSNVTFTGTFMDMYFIRSLSATTVATVTITQSSFTNLRIARSGAFILFNSTGAGSITIDNTTFENVQAENALIRTGNQNLQITDTVFNGTTSVTPSVFVDGSSKQPTADILVKNTVWINATGGLAGESSGAIGINGSDEGDDFNIVFDNASFTNNSGVVSGAILITGNAVTITNSQFAGNAGNMANDVVVLGNAADITESCSLSEGPKAVILVGDLVTDITDLLPDCA